MEMGPHLDLVWASWDLLCSRSFEIALASPRVGPLLPISYLPYPRKKRDFGDPHAATQMPTQ